MGIIVVIEIPWSNWNNDNLFFLIGTTESQFFLHVALFFLTFIARCLKKMWVCMHRNNVVFYLERNLIFSCFINMFPLLCFVLFLILLKTCYKYFEGIWKHDRSASTFHVLCRIFCLSSHLFHCMHSRH